MRPWAASTIEPEPLEEPAFNSTVAFAIESASEVVVADDEPPSRPRAMAPTPTPAAAIPIIAAIAAAAMPRERAALRTRRTGDALVAPLVTLTRRSPASRPPIVMTFVPPSATGFVTRMPSTSTPAELPMSSTSHERPSWTMRAWRRETVGFDSTISLLASRPMLTTDPRVKVRVVPCTSSTSWSPAIVVAGAVSGAAARRRALAGPLVVVEAVVVCIVDGPPASGPWAGVLGGFIRPRPASTALKATFNPPPLAPEGPRAVQWRP